MEAVPPYLTGIIAVLLFSAFVKCITTFSILRYGIGLHGAGFGIALVGLALALTFMALAPQLEQTGGLDGLFKAPLSTAELQQRFGPMLERHTQPAVRERFGALAERLRPTAAAVDSAPSRNTSFAVLAAAYLVSQVSEAFHIGFLILIPFFVIDLLVANVLLLLGATQISQAVVALPIKILLFFSLNGWALLSEKLIGAYA